MASLPVPRASSAGARATMLANRRRDTGPELAVRRLLHAHGLRYRVDFAPDPRDRRRRADIVFTRAKVAVFIDGCFWHGCPSHWVPPKRNAEYWVPKIERNRARDAETTARLIELGWVVLRFWEHAPSEDVADAVELAVRGRSDVEARVDFPRLLGRYSSSATTHPDP